MQIVTEIVLEICNKIFHFNANINNNLKVNLFRLKGYSPTGRFRKAPFGQGDSASSIPSD